MIEDKELLRGAKVRAGEVLRGVDLSRWRLSGVDGRLEGYVRSVADDVGGHCLWEVLSVVRFLRLCRRYGIDVGAVQRFVRFYESLYFPGVRGATRYVLTPVQYFQFCSIFGFVRGGLRVTREACLFVPRKFSKTTSTAALAAYDLLYGDANAEAYTCANSADQAKKCFDVLRGIMRRLDPYGRRYVVNEQMIKSLRRDRSAIAQCLTANARTKDGLSASLVIMDEYSQARDNELLSVLTTSMGIRREPLTVIITTASDVVDGPFHGMLEGYKGVLLREVGVGGDVCEDDDDIFAHLFEPDVDDAEDDVRVWRKVHPHIGVTIGEDFYRREWAAAQRNGAEAMLAFRTKLLNMYSVCDRRSWIGVDALRKVAVPVDLGTYFGDRRADAMVAIDLSVRDDFSAVTAGVYDGRVKGYVFHTAYFFPEGALGGHPNERQYRAWASQGYLRLLRGDVIDYKGIVDYINYLSTVVRIRAIGYDAYDSHEVVNMLRTSGGDGVVRPVRQSYGNFTAPCSAFEHGLYTGHIVVDDNPITQWCFGNAVLDTDNMGNTKPRKRSEYQKIDGVITMLMSMRLFLDARR